MGKRKYISIRKANKAPGVVNFVSYKTLSTYINKIGIGDERSISPIFTNELQQDDVGDGMFRNLVSFAPRLASFYIKVNEKRQDKLKFFNESYTRKNDSSLLFLIAIGGDEAPASGRSFLMSLGNE